MPEKQFKHIFESKLSAKKTKTKQNTMMIMGRYFIYATKTKK